MNATTTTTIRARVYWIEWHDDFRAEMERESESSLPRIESPTRGGIVDALMVHFEGAERFALEWQRGELCVFIGNKLTGEQFAGRIRGRAA